MIRGTLIRVDQPADRVKTRRETPFEGESLALGRGHACAIFLPDHRVKLCHATIRRTADGALVIEASAGALLSVDGYVEREARLVAGTRIGIGPYRLTVDQATVGGHLTLTLEQPDGPENDEPTTHPVSLEALGIDGVKIGLALALLVTLVFLVLPLLPQVSPALDTWQARQPVTLTAALDPGPPTDGHLVVGRKCSVCHRTAFRAVPDTACTECHRRVGAHRPPQDPYADRLNAVNCIDCHAGHRGKAEARRAAKSPCVACHQNLTAKAAEFGDFAESHAEFALNVPVGARTVRVRPGDAERPGEDAGLKFSHAVHLDAKGVSSPAGDTVLSCGACHRPAPGGESMEPVEMEKSCQQSRCHRIRYSGPLRAVVAHGPARQVLDVLRAAYAGALADRPAGAAACPPSPPGASPLRRLLDCADGMARENAATTLFRRDGDNLECALCHTVEDTGDPASPWKIAPVRSRHDWMPRSRFPHQRHATVACADCHDKARSKTSGDYAFPEIARCRQCHAGATGAPGRLASRCEDCHGFHRETTAVGF